MPGIAVSSEQLQNVNCPKNPPTCSYPSPAGGGAGAAGRAPVVAARSHGAGHALLGPAVTERPGLAVACAGRLELGGLGVEGGELKTGFSYN